MSNQTKLFPDEYVELHELALRDAQEIGVQIQENLRCHCEKLEVAGSIRRRKPTVHDVDFVVVAVDKGWHRMIEELKRQRARGICAGNAVIKTLYPVGKNFFQVDF